MSEISEVMPKALKYLKQLNSVREDLRGKSIDKQLTELNFFDRTSKLFSPITETVKKQAQNINKNLDVLKEQLTSAGVSRLALPPPEKYKSIRDHSVFLVHNQQENGDLLYKLKNRDAPQIKYNSKQPNEITIFPNDGSQEIKTKLTDGAKRLLFDIHPDVNKIKTEDVHEYLAIYEAIGDKPGMSNRIKNILSVKSNGEELKSSLQNFNKKSRFIRQIKQPSRQTAATIGEGFAGKQPNKIMQTKSELSKAIKRLSVLLTAYKAGHTNVLQEMTEILDDLIERKIINKKQYLKYFK